MAGCAGKDRKGTCVCVCVTHPCLVFMGSATTGRLLGAWAVKTPCPFWEIFVFLFSTLGGLQESPINSKFH